MSKQHPFRHSHAAHDPAGNAGARGTPPRTTGGGYTLAHAGRQLRIGPLAFWFTVSALATMALWSAGTATYFAFQDDLLTRLIARQADMQYAYEDRLAEMRAQVDRLTSRQLLDQEQVEGRIEQLARRQSTLETRASALAGGEGDAVPTGSIRPGARPLPRANVVPGPGAKPSPLADPAAPPERHSALERLLGLRGGIAPRRRSLAELDGALTAVERSLDAVEARQGAAVSAMEEGVDGKARRIRGILAELGLDLGKLPQGKAAGGVGGPFLPVPAAGEAGAGFERNLERVQFARANLEALTRTLTAVPLRRPLEGELDTSSGFGVRYDPFVRSPAMHTGQDFRAGVGEPVRATAAGTVATAGWSGGYGRMVEIDHGNGFSTRYGHLSEILVSEDQTIRPGQVIGRVGSTGRSTGPHLHYETRVDGEAVDPMRFLRAGSRLGGDL